MPVRGESSFEGYPGVVGSPGYVDENWTEPLWTLVGFLAGPSGYAA